MSDAAAAGARKRPARRVMRGVLRFARSVFAYNAVVILGFTLWITFMNVFGVEPVEASPEAGQGLSEWIAGEAVEFAAFMAMIHLPVAAAVALAVRLLGLAVSHRGWMRVAGAAVGVLGGVAAMGGMLLHVPAAFLIPLLLLPGAAGAWVLPSRSARMLNMLAGAGLLLFAPIVFELLEGMAGE